MTLRVRRLAFVAGTSLTTGVLAVTSAVATTGSGTAWTASHGSARLQSVIVQARAGQAGAVAAAVRASGGHVDRTLSIVNGFAAHVSSSEAAALSRSAAVRAVTPDATLTSASNSYDPSVPGASYAGSVRAPSIWGSGDTGAGVGVALLDTGVIGRAGPGRALSRRHRLLRRGQQPARLVRARHGDRRAHRRQRRQPRAVSTPASPPAR